MAQVTFPSTNPDNDDSSVILLQKIAQAATSGGGGGGVSSPTGTGFVRVTSGVQDGAAVAETGTGSVVRATSPTLVTPTIGVATATSVNGSTVPSSETLVGRATTDTLTNKTLTTPTIASFTNATHTHQNAAGGGALDAAAVTSGVLAIGRLATGTPDGTKFVRDDGTLAVPGGGGYSALEPIVFDGGGFVLASGVAVMRLAKTTFTLSEITLLGDQSGSVAIDIRECTYAQYDAGATHPVSGDSMATGGTAPAISSATKNQITSFAGWANTTVTAGRLYQIIITGSPTSTTKLHVFIK